mgnify:FL=1
MYIGLTKAANESHARDLPVMNGIKEDFKSVVSLEHGSPGILEALQTVATRLRALQVLQSLNYLLFRSYFFHVFIAFFSC